LRLQREVRLQNLLSFGRSKFHSEAVQCSIYDPLVPLEIAKSDEYGRAIHEECYALKMQLKSATTPPPALRESTFPQDETRLRLYTKVFRVASDSSPLAFR
jgi:hypothetical protein